jgi:hypothetical protein
MSPSDPCQILTLKYLTSIDAGDNTFYAKVFNWEGSQPGNTLLYENDITAVEGWIEVDLSADNLFVSGDFVVGFGSVNEQTFLAYDANLNNGRSWDRDDANATWSSWNEAYLIRAVVQYGNGEISEISSVADIPVLAETDVPDMTHQIHGESNIIHYVDPIENRLEIIKGSQVIRTVDTLTERRHQRWYRKSDVEALWALWESQQQPETKVPKSSNSQTPVVVRSPYAYEQLFPSSQEAC